MKKKSVGLLGAVCIVITLVVLPFAAACAQPKPAAGKPPIKIGWLLPTTGYLAAAGLDMEAGARMYFDNAGWEIGGRKIEFIVEDTKALPDVGLMKVKKLIGQDRVDVLAGIVMAHVFAALRDTVHESKTPLVVTTASTAAITEDPKVKSPYVYRVSYTQSQLLGPLGPYAYNELGYRRVVALSPDYVTGYETVDEFKKTFEPLGGKVIDQIYWPLGGGADFAPYIAKIKAMKEADALYVFNYGSDGAKFSNQVVEYGLQLPKLGWGAYVDEAYWPAMNPAGMLGFTSADLWSTELDRPQAKALVKLFRDKTGRMPGSQVQEAWDTSLVIATALKAINGEVQDTPKFLDALSRSQYEGARGRFSFDENHHPVNSVYFCKTEQVAGQLVNVPVAVLQNVKSPWTYSADFWKANFKKLR